MKKKRCNSCTGFTLLEVLVALIILGISLGVIFEGFSRSKRVSLKSDVWMEACRIANNLLADDTLVDLALKEKEQEGEVKDEKGWKYELSAVPLELKQEDKKAVLKVPHMFELRLCLVYGAEWAEKKFCLSRWYRR